MTERPRVSSRIAAGVAALGALLGVLHVRVSDPAEGSVLRIAIRTSAGTGQVCRHVSDAEMAATPVHMRRAEICETHAVPYRLVVRTGDSVLLDHTYEAKGLHGDRPLTVNEDLAMPVGRRDVSIRFTPTTEGSPEFAWDGPVDFAEARIHVASLDSAAGEFELR